MIADLFIPSADSSSLSVNTWSQTIPMCELHQIPKCCFSGVCKKCNEESIDFLSRPVLHLNLRKKWFDMIASGEKKEEYREIKPHWQRVFTSYIKIKGKRYHPSDVNIIFSNGYSKNRRQMLVPVLYLSVNEGKPEWGAEVGKEYFVISLGNPIML